MYSSCSFLYKVVTLQEPYFAPLHCSFICLRFLKARNALLLPFPVLSGKLSALPTLWSFLAAPVVPKGPAVDYTFAPATPKALPSSPNTTPPAKTVDEDETAGSLHPTPSN
jgi:hypothetical protein